MGEIKINEKLDLNGPGACSQASGLGVHVHVKGHFDMFSKQFENRRVRRGSVYDT